MWRGCLSGACTRTRRRISWRAWQNRISSGCLWFCVVALKQRRGSEFVAKNVQLRSSPGVVDVESASRHAFACAGGVKSSSRRGCVEACVEVASRLRWVVHAASRLRRGCVAFASRLCREEEGRRRDRSSWCAHSALMAESPSQHNAASLKLSELLASAAADLKW